MLETIFGKDSFNVYYNYLVWPRSHLLTQSSGIYDLHFSQTPGSIRCFGFTFEVTWLNRCRLWIKACYRATMSVTILPFHSVCVIILQDHRRYILCLALTETFVTALKKYTKAHTLCFFFSFLCSRMIMGSQTFLQHHRTVEIRPATRDYISGAVTSSSFILLKVKI